MFTRIEAVMPLYIPNHKGPINAQIIVDADEGRITIESFDAKVAWELLKLMQDGEPQASVQVV